MAKKQASVRAAAIAALSSIPEDEPIFIIRGSDPAAPETLREHARRTLHIARRTIGTLSAQKDARAFADKAFALADRMEALQVGQAEEEILKYEDTLKQTNKQFAARAKQRPASEIVEATPAKKTARKTRRK
jgi:hypothetical protein